MLRKIYIQFAASVVAGEGVAIISKVYLNLSKRQSANIITVFCCFIFLFIVDRGVILD